MNLSQSQQTSQNSETSSSMVKFLTSSLSGIPTKTAISIVNTLRLQDTSPSELTSSQVSEREGKGRGGGILTLLFSLLETHLSRLQPSVKFFVMSQPSVHLLPHASVQQVSISSPLTSMSLSFPPHTAGEYNLRLGVIKEIKPKLVATFTDKPGVNEGHPFLIEAAVSLGGKSVKEGVNIFRYANRIPLLFETGADVVTQVATKRIKWNLYHMDPKKDAIGVYVSIVSTRIPFKGTSKEYIGDDVLEIQYSVKRALVGCCQQLRQLLHESLSKKEMNEKRKLLVK
jgi:DNA topoisomerase VI B subunit